MREHLATRTEELVPCCQVRFAHSLVHKELSASTYNPEAFGYERIDFDVTIWQCHAILLSTNGERLIRHIFHTSCKLAAYHARQTGDPWPKHWERHFHLTQHAQCCAGIQQ